MLGLRFYARAFSSCGKRGPLFIAVCGPLSIAASVVAEHRLQTRGAQAPDAQSSVVVAHGSSCSAACGIFPEQGSNLRALHWQANAQPLLHQGSPDPVSFEMTPAIFESFFAFCYDNPGSTCTLPAPICNQFHLHGALVPFSQK